MRGIPVGRESHGGHAWGTTPPPHAVLTGSRQNSPRTRYIRPIHFLRIPHPEPVVGSNVEDRIATGHGRFERRWIAQASAGRLGVEPLEIPKVTSGTHQETAQCSLRAPATWQS